MTSHASLLNSIRQLVRTDMNDINILFVDDEKFTLHSLDRLLRKETYNTFFAESGEKALEMIPKNDIHIVVSDMKMPEMDGLTLLRKIKENSPNIVRLVLSAYTQTAQLLPCINSGEVFRFITKPLDKNELKTALTDAIELHLIQRDNKKLVESLQKCNEEMQITLDKKKIVENRMKTLCGVDEITSLYNRRQLYVSMEQELNKFHRYGNIFSGLMLELDHAQNILETHDNSFCNYVIKEFVDRLQASIRNIDITFRYAEYKFFVMLPETRIDQVQNMGQRIVVKMNNGLLKIEGKDMQQTVSIGACSLDKTTSLSPESFLSITEKMLLTAKERGGNQIVCNPAE